MVVVVDITCFSIHHSPRSIYSATCFPPFPPVPQASGMCVCVLST